MFEVNRWALAVREGLFGVWDLDPALEVVHYSPAWKQRLGFPDPQLPDSTAFWRCRVHPDDLEPMLLRIRSHLDGFSAGYEMTFRLRSNGSGYRTVLSRGRVVARDQRGNPTRMLGTMADITGREVGPASGLAESENVPLLLPRARTPLHALLADSLEQQGHAEGSRLLSDVSDLLDRAWQETRPNAGAALKR